MTGYERILNDADLADDDNVVMFRPRVRATTRRVEREQTPAEMERYPVDIRGNVTFGRLMSGLATVGLTVRVDARSGRVIIADESVD
jgi:hypothetical protein